MEWLNWGVGLLIYIHTYVYSLVSRFVLLVGFLGWDFGLVLLCI